MYLPNLDWIIGNIEDISSDIKFIKQVSKNYIVDLKFEESGHAWIVKNRVIINENSSVLEFANKAIDNEEGEFLDYLNNDSLQEITAYAEPSLKEAKPEDKFQFERKGYFCMDRWCKDGELVFNRTVTLRDAWSKKNK